MNWTTPGDITNQLERHWLSGRLLTAQLRNEPLFPFVPIFKKPATADLAQRFDEVRTWIKELESASKPQTGFGYEIEWSVRNHRQIGRNLLPARVVVPNESDALQLLGKSDTAERFYRLTEMSLQAFPNLENWLTRHPLTVLTCAEDWSQILDVLAWLVANPASGIYVRQIEIAGVDTKFIEERKGLFLDLLEAVRLPRPDRQSDATKTFEQRCGLSPKPAMIRFRFLDKTLYMQGLSDLAMPAADFARLSPGATTVFITENEINGLAFPDFPSSLVIFGLGYGLERLSQATWLAGCDMYYWGDIDTHGFAMLDRLRAIFPNVQSFLMDQETLFGHRASWVREQEQYNGSLDRLTAGEQSLFGDLRNDCFGLRVRLEQERVSFARVKRALRTLEEPVAQRHGLPNPVW